MMTIPRKALPRVTTTFLRGILPACALCLTLAGATTSILNAATPFRDMRVQEPRRLWLQGRYAEAEAACRKLLDESPAAAILLARCQHEQAQLKAAQKTLANAVEFYQFDAEALAMLHAERGLLMLAESDLEAAHKTVELTLQSKQPTTRVAAEFVTAEVHRLDGRVEEADKAYQAIVDRVAEDWAAADPESMLLITRAALAQAERKGGVERFRTIVNKMLPAIERREPNYWPAMQLGAEIFAAKFNYAQAKAETDRALAINPNAIPTLAAIGRTAVERYNFARGQSAIKRIRRVAPDALEADVLDAQLALMQWQYAKAVELLRGAAAARPSERIRGMLTAALWAQSGSHLDPPPQASKLIDEAVAKNPHCGRYFEEIGKQLDAMRKYPHAAPMLRRAIKVDPKRIGPRAQLGLLLMRLGEESEAGRLLDESFKTDPFNVRVKNMLAVLDVLNDYAVLETEHFILRFDRGVDGVLAESAARRLEETIYPEVTKQLGFEPEGKTLFEIFSNRGASAHSLFSARMSGLPFVGAVGACAGKMVAFTSPNSIRQKFNWAQLLKHEFVHVVNLQQSNFHVPHWFTEAMALRIERPNRPAEWNELLARRRQAGQLFNLDTLNLGFIRPQNSNDWTLAYCQSELYLEYLVAEHGPETPLNLLAAFANNETVDTALRSALNTDKAAVEAGYQKYVESIVQEVKLPTIIAEPSLAELNQRAAESMQNPDAQAELAAALLANNRKAEARRAALAALELAENHPLGQYVMARLELSIGDNDSAETRLQSAYDAESPDEQVLALLAALKIKQERWAEAIELFENADRCFPHPTRWRKQLARAYLKSGNQKQLYNVLAALAESETDNLLYRRKLIQMAQAGGENAAVVKWTRQSLEIDVMDAEHHAAKGEAHLRLDQPELAVHHLTIAVRLSPEQVLWKVRLAEALSQSGQSERAAKMLQRLRKEAPENTDVQKALRKLNL